jgi:hypothetical protein
VVVSNGKFGDQNVATKNVATKTYSNQKCGDENRIMTKTCGDQKIGNKNLW